MPDPSQLDNIREEINRQRARLDEVERRLAGVGQVNDKVLRFLQGDADLKDKGLVDKMQEINTFISETKELELKTLAPLLRQIMYIAKYFGWLIAGTLALITGAGVFVTNLDRILNSLHVH